jgi:hypothetical protein
VNAQERIDNLLPDPHETARSIEAQASALWVEAMKAQAAHEAMLKATTVHLQGIGRHKAKRADQFQPGDSVVWNYGSTDHITGIREVSAKFLEFEFAKPYKALYDIPNTRRFRKDRLIAYR